MPPNTETIQQELQQLKINKKRFLSKHGNTIRDDYEPTDPELREAQRALASLGRERDKIWPFKEFPQQQLKEQYQFQKEAFQSIGLLKELSPHTFGLFSEETIDGQSYPFPSFEEIRRTMIKNKDILSIKINQEFNRLLIVPIALKLPVFQDKIGSFIKTKQSQRQLLGTKTPRSAEFIELGLNNDSPIYIHEDIINGEQSGALLYYVEQFNKPPYRGFTKQELMTTLALSPFPGYEVLLLPPDMYLPKEGEGEPIGGRKPLENGDTSKNYLKTITDPDPDSPYSHELGLTLEADLTDFSLYLANTNHVKYDLNDYNGVNLIGSYLKTTHVSGSVLGVSWNRDGGRLYVGRGFPGDRDAGWGCLSAVRVCGNIFSL